MRDQSTSAPLADTDLERDCVAEKNGTFRRHVRQDMAHLPRILQPAITYITGKPLPGETPRIHLSPTVRIIVDILALFGMTAGMVAGLVARPYIFAWLLPIFWLLATGAIRRFQVVYAHHAAHGALSQRPWVNQVLGDLLTTIALIQNAAEYKHSHQSHHRKGDFTTIRDIGAQFLWKFGFRPGMSKRALWLRFWWTMVSPAFHFRFLVARARSNFVSPPLYRRLMSVIWVALLGAIAFAIPTWVFCVAIIVPLVPLYHISTFLNTITEHGWSMGEKGLPDRAAYRERCWARFCGEPLPPNAGRGLGGAFAYGAWASRMILFHLPVRLSVLVGDTPAHDWHHLVGYGRHRFEWPYAIYFREEAIAQGHGAQLEEREIWGIGNVIAHVFSFIQAAQTSRPALQVLSVAAPEVGLP